MPDRNHYPHCPAPYNSANNSPIEIGFLTAFENPSWYVTQTRLPAFNVSFCFAVSGDSSDGGGVGSLMTLPKKSRFTFGPCAVFFASPSSLDCPSAVLLEDFLPIVDVVSVSDCLRMFSLRYSWSRTWRIA